MILYECVTFVNLFYYKGERIMNESINLNNSEWYIMEVLWENQPKTLMQIAREMKEKQGWSRNLRRGQ